MRSEAGGIMVEGSRISNAASKGANHGLVMGREWWHVQLLSMLTQLQVYRLTTWNGQRPAEQGVCMCQNLHWSRAWCTWSDVSIVPQGHDISRDGYPSRTVTTTPFIHLCVGDHGVYLFCPADYSAAPVCS
jgi:hypothetical protein